jgi:hypothetical protein
MKEANLWSVPVKRCIYLMFAVSHLTEPFQRNISYHSQFLAHCNDGLGIVETWPAVYNRSNTTWKSNRLEPKYVLSAHVKLGLTSSTLLEMNF